MDNTVVTDKGHTSSQGLSILDFWLQPLCANALGRAGDIGDGSAYTDGVEVHVVDVDTNTLAVPTVSAETGRRTDAATHTDVIGFRTDESYNAALSIAPVPERSPTEVVSVPGTLLFETVEVPIDGSTDQAAIRVKMQRLRDELSDAEKAWDAALTAGKATLETTLTEALASLERLSLEHTAEVTDASLQTVLSIRDISSLDGELADANRRNLAIVRECQKFADAARKSVLPTKSRVLIEEFLRVVLTDIDGS